MAGSIVVAVSDIGGNITKYSVAWTSDASGNVNANSFAMKRGFLLQFKTVPGSGGSAPTSYGLTVLDADSWDILNGAGASQSATAAAVFAPLIGNGTTNARSPLIEAGNVTPTITGAGASKSGRLDLLIG